jgi:hypothetical protein
MHTLLLLALVSSGALVLGFALGRGSLRVRPRSGSGRGSLARLAHPVARPALRVIAGGRVRGGRSTAGSVP